MNIFASSPCPRQSAEYLDDKRVVKMVLESAQILSTVMHLRGGTGPYRPTHAAHPCTVWAAENVHHYAWLLRHFMALAIEYNKRYSKTHKCVQYATLFADFMDNMPGDLADPIDISFVNCTPYKHIEDVHQAYRQTLVDKWMNDLRVPGWKITHEDYNEQY